MMTSWVVNCTWSELKGLGKLLIITLFGVCLYANFAAAASCLQETQPEIKALTVRISELEKSTPSIGTGPQVEIGKCARTLKKLEGNFLCCRTFSNTAPNWEEISCLQLRKFYLRKSCTCISSGGFSNDPELQDRVLNASKALKTLRRKAIEKGVPNAIIQSFVKDMTKATDCINHASEQYFTETIDGLNKVLDVNY